MITILFGVSMGEIVLVFLVVLLLFGANKIPDFARTLGKGMNEFRKAAEDIKREFRENTEDLKEDIEDARKSLVEEGHLMKEDLKRAKNDFSHSVDEVSQKIYNLNDDGTPKENIAETGGQTPTEIPDNVSKAEKDAEPDGEDMKTPGDSNPLEPDDESIGK